MISDSAVYVDGRRSDDGLSGSLRGTREACRQRGGFAWIGLQEPSREEFDSVAGEFGLPEPAVREAIKAYARPRVDHYGETLLVVLMASREVIRFHHATRPLAGALERLTGDEAPGIDPEARRYLRGVEEKVLKVTERIEGLRELLSNILGVNLTMVGIRQNEQVQKVSAWAAILVVPTIITGIYGMNFRHMPELHWLLGYPLTLVLMVVVSALIYLGFRRSGWL